MTKLLLIIISISFTFGNDKEYISTMFKQLSEKNNQSEMLMKKNEFEYDIKIKKLKSKHKSNLNSLNKENKSLKMTISELKDEIQKLRIAQPKTKIIKEVIYRDITSSQCKKRLLKESKLNLPPKLDINSIKK